MSLLSPVKMSFRNSIGKSITNQNELSVEPNHLITHSNMVFRYTCKSLGTFSKTGEVLTELRSGPNVWLILLRSVRAVFYSNYILQIKRTN